jgi:Uma2 family endonuclease
MITDMMEQQADAMGIRLEYINGIPIWEASPVIRHQRIVDRIRAGISPTQPANLQRGHDCGCIHYADIYILFPDGSIKRPDISIFCNEPAEQDTMCETIPQVVIEILSKGYEKKDTEISLPFYLAQGIADIVIFDPATNRVSHYHEDRADEALSPTTLTFACGCRTIV